MNTFRHELSRYAKKELWLDLLYDILGSILYAIGVYTFAVGADFAPGGVSGMAVIIHHFFKQVPIGTCILCINIPIILLCYRVMGKMFLIKSVKTMVISSFFLDAVFPHFPLYQSDPLLASIFSGVFMGMGLAFIYMRGSSTGGSDFFILSLNKLFPHRSIAQITMIADGSIVVLGGLLYGRIDALLMGVVATFASSRVIDAMLTGKQSGKMVTIITSKGQDTADTINKEVGRGSTIIPAAGTYTGEPRQILMCACSKNQISAIRKIAFRMDLHAIVTVGSYDEAFGEGFQDPNN